MAASLTRSSARVSPRSVTRVAAISPTTSSSVAGGRAHRARARHVADGAVADRHALRRLAVEQLDVLGDRVEHPVAGEHLALVGEVDRGQLEPLRRDVLPDVELGPVGDREHAHVLAAADAAVVEVPELRALAARVPLAEVVAEREDPLLRPRALLVAARAAERGVEAVRLDRVEERGRLKPVAGGARTGLLDDAAAVDRLLHRGDEQLDRELLDEAVAERDHLREVVPGVDVHQGERHVARPERLAREVGEDDRVLAAAEQQHGALQLGRHLPDDVDRLGLEGLQVRQREAGACSPHSVFSSPAQRPSRPAPGSVQCVQPIDE